MGWHDPVFVPLVLKSAICFPRPKKTIGRSARAAQSRWRMGPARRSIRLPEIYFIFHLILINVRLRFGKRLFMICVPLPPCLDLFNLVSTIFALIAHVLHA
jgi:hypothetical protein